MKYDIAAFIWPSYTGDDLYGCLEAIKEVFGD